MVRWHADTCRLRAVGVGVLRPAPQHSTAQHSALPLSASVGTHGTHHRPIAARLDRLKAQTQQRDAAPHPVAQPGVGATCNMEHAAHRSAAARRWRISPLQCSACTHATVNHSSTLSAAQGTARTQRTTYEMRKPTTLYCTACMHGTNIARRARTQLSTEPNQRKGDATFRISHRNHAIYRAISSPIFKLACIVQNAEQHAALSLRQRLSPLPLVRRSSSAWRWQWRPRAAASASQRLLSLGLCTRSNTRRCDSPRGTTLNGRNRGVPIHFQERVHPLQEHLHQLHASISDATALVPAYRCNGTPSARASWKPAWQKIIADLSVSLSSTTGGLRPAWLMAASGEETHTDCALLGWPSRLPRAAHCDHTAPQRSFRGNVIARVRRPRCAGRKTSDQQCRP